MRLPRTSNAKLDIHVAWIEYLQARGVIEAPPQSVDSDVEVIEDSETPVPDRKRKRKHISVTEEDVDAAYLDKEEAEAYRRLRVRHPQVNAPFRNSLALQ